MYQAYGKEPSAVREQLRQLARRCGVQTFHAALVGRQLTRPRNVLTPCRGEAAWLFGLPTLAAQAALSLRWGVF